MRKKPPINLAASVRQRLLNLSKERNEVFDLVLTQYANERFLYRLASSKYGDQFVLKGAALFVAWTGRSHRPTRDLDLLGYGDPSTHRLAELMKSVCRQKVEPDGLEFVSGSVQVSEIRGEHEYGGIRVELRAELEEAKISLQIDVGFGDVVVPSIQEITYPVLLDFPAPRIKGYSHESVVAEKLQAIVALGLVNTRMKDFYDLSALADGFLFKGETLVEAIKATFARRLTPIPREPVALTEDFYDNQEKSKQWMAFLRRSHLGVEENDLIDVVMEIRRFLMPPLEAITLGADFRLDWSKGGPWQ
jgi:predicted nucleotidyltransferase component of viral defense system